MSNYCVTCGADISHRGIRAQRCEACAKKRERYLDSLRRGGETLRDDLAAVADPQCVGCRFLNSRGIYCNYMSIMGHSRSSLHKGEQGGINHPCRERQEVTKREKVPVL